MSCYAIQRTNGTTAGAVVLVFPNPMLRSTYIGSTVEYKGYYEECSAKEAYKYLFGANRKHTNVLDMRIMEYWDDKPLELALERGLGNQFV